MIAAGNLFTSCIQQLEPTGIQEMREAKAEYYEALAGLKNADAEYRQAQARYEDARTKLKEAEVKAKELENAAKELANAKQEALDEMAIAKAQAECEAKLVEWQTTITNNQKKLAQAEYELQEKLRNIAAASIGLNAAERRVLNKAITGYEDAIKEYNKAVADLYRAQLKLYEAQYDKAAGIAETDYKHEKIEDFAKSYEDSVAEYKVKEAYFVKKLAEYTLTDDPAVWAAELAEIQDSLDFWRYQANIVDADMAKKFAVEYYDGVKAWNEAYAAYVEANEPEKPALINPDEDLFYDEDGHVVDYTKELPVHTYATRTFVNYFNTYLKEWTAGVAKIVTPGETIFSDRNDVFTVSGLTIDNYDLFLNGDPKNKDVIGLNGILETLERDLVLKGDATSVADLKEKMEDAQKKFYSADSVVRAGLFGYTPFTDTLNQAKEAYANMRQEAKSLADAQTALVKAISDYAKGLGKSSLLWAGNPISSTADSVALFNAIKNFAQARVDYFGDGSILSEYTSLTEKEAIALFKKWNSLVYIKADNMFQPKRDSVALQDIEFSGFNQAAVLPSYLNPISKPVSEKIDGYYYAKGMTFNSLYGGAGYHWNDELIPYYVGCSVNLGTNWTNTGADPYPWPESTVFWQYAYEVGQQVPALSYEKDAFIKAISLILEASQWLPEDFYNEVTTSVDFWTKLANVIKTKTAADFATTGLYYAKTDTNTTTKEVKVMIGDKEVVSQTVLELGQKVMDNIDAFAKIYNEYWGAGSTDLARTKAEWTKDGQKVDVSKDSQKGWTDLVTKLVSGAIDGVKDIYGNYNWSVKTFTEPYKIVYYDRADNRPINFKELRIALQNLGLLAEGDYNTLKHINSIIFNCPEAANAATLLTKMFQAEQAYEMYANAKDAIEIVKQLKGVDADVKAAAAEVQKALDADKAAMDEYTKKYGEFYTALTGEEPLETVELMQTEVKSVMKDKDYILHHIEADQWTVKGEKKAMAEKYLPTYPADYHATQQLKGHSAEMVELYEGLYNALDKTYLTAVVMRDGKYTEGQLVTIPLPWGGEWSFVWGVWTFEEAYANVIEACSDNIEDCEKKIAYFEKMIALVEAGFGPVDARISALEAQVEYYTQKLVDAQVKLDVAKAKYDEAVAAYAE